MKNYELNYLISSELDNESLEKLTQGINNFIQKQGGIIIKSGAPTKKVLSYPIKKQGAGLWVILEFQLSPDKIKELEEKIEKDGQILRRLLVIKKISKKPFGVLRNKKKPSPVSSFVGTREDKKEKTEKKVELKEIEKKLDEILNE